MRIIKDFKNFDQLNLYLLFIFNKAFVENFKFIFTGGITPIPFYNFLNKKDIDLSTGTIFLSDERLGVLFEETNEYTILNNLNSKNINLLKYDYTGKIINPIDNFPPQICNIEYFNFAILGIGEDGHVASIFPNNTNLLNSDKLISLIDNSPKPPINRITMTPKCLKKSKIIVYIINGKRKKHIFNNLLNTSNLIYENIFGLDMTYFLYTNEEI